MTIKEIGEMADECGFPIYVVGGFVRDIILKRKNLDLDVVVEADAIRLAQILASQKSASLIVHNQFGTATVIIPNNVKVDVATARKEGYPYPGALPIVEAGSMKEDLFRRDFTINTLAIRINRKYFGQLRDDFNGLEDFKSKKIRVLHDKSFRDDPTRILRAVRFEQRFNFKLETKTLRLLKAALKKRSLKNVKPERFFAEFKKMLNEPTMLQCVTRLRDLGGLEYLGIHFQWDQSIVRLAAQIEKDFKIFGTSLLNGGKIERWLINFMALTHKTSMNNVKKMLLLFNFKKIDSQKILACFHLKEVSRKLSSPRLKASEIYQILKPFGYETIFFFKTTTPNVLVKKRINDFLGKYDAIKLSINGHDLQSMGISSGKKFGLMLNSLLYQKIDGRLPSREDELKEAEQLSRS